MVPPPSPLHRNSFCTLDVVYLPVSSPLRIILFFFSSTSAVILQYLACSFVAYRFLLGDSFSIFKRYERRRWRWRSIQRILVNDLVQNSSQHFLILPIITRIIIWIESSTARSWMCAELKHSLYIHRSLYRLPCLLLSQLTHAHNEWSNENLWHFHWNPKFILLINYRGVAIKSISTFLINYYKQIYPNGECERGHWKFSFECKANE